MLHFATRPGAKIAAYLCNRFMSNIRPLKKLVNKARDLRASHSARHRPTGFGFALADSIDAGLGRTLVLPATHILRLK